MKKLLGILVLGLLFFSNVNAEERESELNNLFKQLKNSEATKAIEIENKTILSAAITLLMLKNNNPRITIPKSFFIYYLN